MLRQYLWAAAAVRRLGKKRWRSTSVTNNSRRLTTTTATGPAPPSTASSSSGTFKVLNSEEEGEPSVIDSKSEVTSNQENAKELAAHILGFTGNGDPAEEAASGYHIDSKQTTTRISRKRFQKLKVRRDTRIKRILARSEDATTRPKSTAKEKKGKIKKESKGKIKKESKGGSGHPVVPEFLEGAGKEKDLRFNNPSPLSISRTEHLVIVQRMTSLIRFGFPPSNNLKEEEEEVLPSSLRGGEEGEEYIKSGDEEGADMPPSPSSALATATTTTTSINIAAALYQMKKEEEELFTDLDLFSMHIPKTVEGLLFLAGMSESVIRRYQSLPKAVKQLWTLDNILGSEISREHREKKRQRKMKKMMTNVLKEEEEEEQQQQNMVSVEDIDDGALNDGNNDKAAATMGKNNQSVKSGEEKNDEEKQECTGQGEEEGEEEEVMYLQDFSKKLKLTERMWIFLRLAVEETRARIRGRSARYKRQTKGRKYNVFLQLLRENKEKFLQYLISLDDISVSKRDLTFFDLYWQYLPVSEWYDYLLATDNHREDTRIAIQLARDIIDRLHQHDKELDGYVINAFISILKDVKKNQDRASKERQQRYQDMSVKTINAKFVGLKLKGHKSYDKYKKISILEKYDKGEATEDMFLKARYFDTYYRKKRGDMEKARWGTALSTSDPGRESLLFYCKNKLPFLESIVSQNFDHLDPALILQAWYARPTAECTRFTSSLVAVAPAKILSQVSMLLERYHSGILGAEGFERGIANSFLWKKQEGGGNMRRKIGKPLEFDVSDMGELLRCFYPAISPLDIIGTHRDLFLGRYAAAFKPKAAISSAGDDEGAAVVAPSLFQSSLADSKSDMLRIAANLHITLDPMSPSAMHYRENVPVERKFLIRNIDPNLTPLDIAHGLRHVGRLSGVELMREHLADVVPFMALEKYQNLVEGKETIKARMRINSEVYGWVYFDDEEGARQALSPDVGMLGVFLHPTHVVFKKVDPSRESLPGVFKGSPEHIACMAQLIQAEKITGLYVGNIPFDVSLEETKEKLQRVFASTSFSSHDYSLEDSFLMDATVPEGQGYAGIVFDTHENASAAYRILTSGVRIGERKVQATWVGNFSPHLT